MILRRGAGRAFLLLTTAAISSADILTPDDSTFGLLAVVPPLATAVGLGPLETSLFGTLATLVAGLHGLGAHAYTPEHLPVQLVRLVTIISTSVIAVVLSCARERHERHLVQMIRVAETAQRAILTQVPDCLGPFRVAVHYESAASDALVGGDLYGLILTKYGLRALIGDVRGKGLEAVQLTAQILAAFRERANDHPDLVDLMDHLNRAAVRCASAEDFVTALLVQIADDGTMTLTNAGHPPPYLKHCARVDQLAPQAPRLPLGFDDRTTTSTLSLSVSDRLLLYTDGLTEARDPIDRSFLPAQIIANALQGSSETAEIIDRLRHAVLDWSGGQLNDDIAMVLIEYQPARTLA